MRTSRLLSTLAVCLLVVLAGALIVQAQTQSLAERNSALETRSVIGLPDDEGDDEGDDGNGSGNPDPPCFSNVTRFTDCGNGTVTDGVTGLIWLKNAHCLGSTDWATANKRAAALGDGTHPACELTDGSSPGDWRLPTLGCPYGFCQLEDAIGEFVSIVAPTCPAPFIPNTAGTGCWSEGDPFSGVLTSYYWSSTSDAGSPQDAWGAILGYGYASNDIKIGAGIAWPVRVGH